MADPKADLTLPTQEPGFLFRLEMWITSFLLGYWRHVIAVLVLGLAAVLIYGQYYSSMRHQQRDMSAQIALSWADIPTDADPSHLSATQKAKITGIADTLAGYGASFNGAAAAEAYLRAAELYRLLGDSESQRKCLEGAVPIAKGPLLYAARSGIANLDFEAGNTDAAIAAWRDMMDHFDGYLAEEAALSLGQIYMHLDRPSDARSIYVEFQSKWPDSPRLADVAERMARLDAMEAEGTSDVPEPGLTPDPGTMADPLAPDELAPAPQPAPPMPVVP